MPTLAETVMSEAQQIESSAVHLEQAARQTMSGTAAGFMKVTLDAVPRWALATIGTMTGFGLALSLLLFTSGMTNPLQHVLEAFATSIERSSTKFDEATNKLDRVIGRLDKMQERYEATAATVAAHDQRLAVVETKVEAMAATIATPSSPAKSPPPSQAPLALSPRPASVQKKKPLPAIPATPVATTTWPFN